MSGIISIIENNLVLSCAIIGWAAAQLLKTIIHLILSRKFVAERLVGSGGMPSSHSATVCGLATAALIEYGYSSFQFAISATLAIIVMYDAMGVRRQAGKQAIVLNEVLILLKDMGNKLISPEEKLKELVGHTPLQVVMGAILGIVLALIICLPSLT